MSVELTPTTIEPDPSSRWGVRAILSGTLAWTAILVATPLVMTALTLLIPNLVELLDRIFSTSLAPRRYLVAMLIVQILIITLPVKTFLSWRRDHFGLRAQSAWRTVGLACATLAVALFAYAWIAAMVAAFPD